MEMESDSDHEGASESEEEFQHNSEGEESVSDVADVESEGESEAASSDQSDWGMAEQEPAKSRGKGDGGQPSNQSLANAMAKILERDVGDEAPIMALDQGKTTLPEHPSPASKGSQRKKKIVSHISVVDSSGPRERRLRVVATRGVVHLFNAIMKAQKSQKPAITPGGDTEKQKATGPKWEVLKDDMLTSSKMSEWDAADATQGIASDSDASQ